MAKYEIILICVTLATLVSSNSESNSCKTRTLETINPGLTLTDKLEMIDVVDHVVEKESIPYVTCQNFEETLKKLRTAIDKGVDYTINNYPRTYDSIEGSLEVVLGVLNNVIDGVVEGVGLNDFSISNWLNLLLPKIKSLRAHSKFQAKLDAYKNFQMIGFSEWKPLNTLDELKSELVETVGEQQDGAWTPLFKACVARLRTNCEVPYVCERTLLNPEPQSQRLLSQQATYLLMHGMNKQCERLPDFNERLSALSAKMTLEAEFLSDNNFPAWGRKLMLNYVILTGMSDFQDCMRQDWIENIISWQHPNGCFENTEATGYEIVKLSEVPSEVRSEPACDLSMTARGLAAMTAYLGWLANNCLA